MSAELLGYFAWQFSHTPRLSSRSNELRLLPLGVVGPPGQATAPEFVPMLALLPCA